MTNEQFYNEATYQLILFYAQDLFDQGILTEEVFNQFKGEMLEQYSPIISRLSG